MVFLALDLGVCSSQGLKFHSAGADFNGLVLTEFCSGFKRHHKWMVGLDPSYWLVLGSETKFKRKKR